MLKLAIETTEEISSTVALEITSSAVEPEQSTTPAVKVRKLRKYIFSFKFIDESLI
jgi:hypothetical protein